MLHDSCLRRVRRPRERVDGHRVVRQRRPQHPRPGPDLDGAVLAPRHYTRAVVRPTAGQGRAPKWPLYV